MGWAHAGHCSGVAGWAEAARARGVRGVAEPAERLPAAAARGALTGRVGLRGTPGSLRLQWGQYSGPDSNGRWQCGQVIVGTP